MIKMIGKTVRGIIGTRERVGTIYDITADGSRIWVETESDLYVVDAEAVEIVEEQPKRKGSASMTFGKYEILDCFEEVEARFLTVDVLVKGKTKEEVEANFEALADRLVEVSNYTFEWSTCPTVDEYNGVWSYHEMFTLEYEHGFMTEMKKDLMADFKAVKKEMGLK